MNSLFSYNNALAYLYSRQQLGIKLGLANIRWVLNQLGAPQQQFLSIHIAGTNGKGSTAAFISNILQQAGFKVGLYTSPHLIDFRERICINGEQIPAAAVAELTNRLRQLLTKDSRDYNPTFFEFTTALAFTYFAEQGIDFAILETGMGGRLDATNVVSPAVAVITNISLEHQQYLGNSELAIAGEKAGIIKRGGCVISGVQQPRLLNLLQDICRQREATLHLPLQDFQWKRLRQNLNGQVFSLKSWHSEFPEVRMRLLGDFQLDNALLAIATIELIQEQGFHITNEAILGGIAVTYWPGRLQIISSAPLVVLDGAHNPAAVSELVTNISTIFTYRRLILVLGIMQDKDLASMITPLASLADTIILTRPDSERAASPQQLQQHIPPANGRMVLATETVVDAVNKARVLSGSNDLVLVTGSLYTVGEALAAVGKNH